MLCYRRLIDDDQAMNFRFEALCHPERRLPESRDQRRAIFLPPEQSPILSFVGMIRAPGPARSPSRTGVTARQRDVTPVRFAPQADSRTGLRRSPRRMGG